MDRYFEKTGVNMSKISSNPLLLQFNQEIEEHD